MSTEQLALHSLLKPIDPNVYPKERVQMLWDNLQSQDYAFDDVTRGDSSFFLAQFMLPSNLFFELGDMQGFVSAISIQPHVNCLLHFSVWKQIPMPQLLSAANSLVGRLFTAYELNRQTAFIPNPNEKAKRLAVLLGFKYEGAIRKAFLSKGEYSDLLIYGVLRSEFETFRKG